VARLVGDRLTATSRRVTIKTRLVNLKKAPAGSAIAHLRYIERDGVTPAGERGQAYGADTDHADIREFEKRGAEDRHQFRFIVSPEDAAEYGDLKTYTRDLMSQMEQDLQTRLEWVAVDHWDTEHPHTHIVLRGMADDGKDLVIARDYISHGMRVRASELMTQSLGPRTERDIEASLAREVTQERWTGLDAAIERCEKEHVVAEKDLPGATALIHRSLLVGRLETLKDMGLTERQDAGWQMAANWQPTLRSMGERGDIIRTMQRAMGEERQEVAFFDPAEQRPPVVGRIAAKGFVNEIEDRPYLMVDGLDGRAHYVKLPQHTDLAALPKDGIVEIRSATSRASDRTIANVAVDGIYRTETHLTLARSHANAPLDPKTYVEGHVRRLEALRRAGFVERIEEGVWRIPSNLEDRGRLHDAERTGGVAVTLHSHLSVREQAHAIGATWLDRQLLAHGQVPVSAWGAALKTAYAEREAFLIDQGLARRTDKGVIYARDLLNTLRTRELDTIARAVTRDTGLEFKPTRDGARVSGIYRRDVQLASGRFAMLDDGVGFSLVPWRPVLDTRLGEHLSATVSGPSVSWDFGRKRGLSR
jgi:type IV secretory pathway VirD2 relaxase